MSVDFDTNANENYSFNSDPIYNFPNLKNRLTDMGVQIGQAGVWRSVGTVDVLPNDIGKRIFFESGGIFYIDDEGIKRQGFMYKARFYFEWKGEKKHPKFHICKCSTIENFGQEAYRFANAEPIKIYSRNTGKEVEVESMELCEYCKQQINEEVREDVRQVYDSTDFVKILKKAGDEESSQYDVDIFGYVKNWEEISRAYRIKKDFTCERCGTHVEDLDHFYMQTHHKNGVKTDNNESNLECLCVRCHSEVDDIHRRNFSSAAKKIVIEGYMHKYHKKDAPLFPKTNENNLPF